MVSPADSGVDRLGKAVESLAPLIQSTRLLGMLSMVPLVLLCPVHKLLIHRELEYDGSSPKHEARNMPTGSSTKEKAL